MPRPPKGKSHMWTKDDLKKVLQLWESNTKEEIAAEIGVTELQLYHAVGQLRKAGFNIPKKHKKGQLRNLLEELAASAEFSKFLVK